MKISVSWLKEWLDDLPLKLADRLTMAGLEVEGEMLAAPHFTKVVVGEVKTVSSHPNADKLVVTQVDIGESELLQIVCGAPNVAVGIKVPTAIVGATLPQDFTIKKTKLRGVESQGMLCSSKELGLDEEGTGLMILANDSPLGLDFRELYQLDDQILELDLTPNRGDCLSQWGMARDIAAITNQPLKAFPSSTIEEKHQDTYPVTVASTRDCPRFLGRVIKNLNPAAETPLWMRERLRRLGVRPHGILVDVTNYVLFELGQPLHAYDLNKLTGPIHVRYAKEGESLTLINEDKVTLSPDTLLITDDSGPISMAGIMGGLSTSCDEKTTDIFLESAWFNPLTIAGRARNYGLHTDSSHRFERGVDYGFTKVALDRATELLVEYAGGEAGPLTMVEKKEHLPTRVPISLRYSRVNKIIGKAFSATEIIHYCERIGQIVESNEDSLLFEAPSYRFDLKIEEDLIEEVARLDGYENVPISLSWSSPLTIKRVPENRVPLLDFKKILVARDYHEIIAMSFINPKWQQILAGEEPVLRLKNPISNDLSVMRTTLLAGVLGAMEYNLKRQQTRLRFFESGRIYRGSFDNLLQETHLAGAICGDITEKEWGEHSRPVDFFDLKGDVEALLRRTGYLSDKENTFQYLPYYENSYSAKVKEEVVESSLETKLLHPGQSARLVTKEGREIGFLGKLHPLTLKALDLNTDVFVFELNLSSLEASVVPNFTELPKFPSSRRDLALVVPEAISHETLVEAMEEKGGEFLQAITLFDYYQKPATPADGGAKDKSEAVRNVAYSLLFQNPNASLKDEEIDGQIQAILARLKEYSVSLRQ